MRGNRRAVWSDLLARATVGVLFALLCVNLLQDFLQTRRVTGLLLLASEALVVILTIFRRRAQIVDRSPEAVITVFLSVVGPPLLRTAPEGAWLPDALTAFVSSVGLLIVVFGKLTIGRSFGIAPANRGIVTAGPYLFVRHPIYTGYLISHLAFVAAHPTLRNIALVVVGDSALIVRALIEERVLTQDDGYREYCGRVRWHLVPGVF